jgi:hypothetical protein
MSMPDSQYKVKDSRCFSQQVKLKVAAAMGIEKDSKCNVRTFDWKSVLEVVHDATDKFSL